MFPGHPDPSGFLLGVRLGGEFQEIRAGAKTGFQLSGLPVRLGSRSSQAHPGEVGRCDLQNQLPPIQDSLLRETTHVLDRPSHSDGKTGAPEEPLAYSGIAGEGHPNSKVPSSTPDLLVKGGIYPARPTPATPSSRCSDLTDASNEGWGAHSGDYTRKQAAFKFPLAKLSLVSPQGV